MRVHTGTYTCTVHGVPFVGWYPATWSSYDVPVMVGLPYAMFSSTDVPRYTLYSYTCGHASTSRRAIHNTLHMCVYDVYV